MFIYYITSAFKNLYRNGIFSAINIFGFAFSISVCLAIATFLVHEYSFDSYNKNAKHIYKLIDSINNSGAIDYRVEKIILENYPEIKDACISHLESTSYHFRVGGKGFYINNILSCDNAFFNIFSVKIKRKNSITPFTNKNSVVINESTAKLIFGDDDPLGKEIIVFNNKLIITAVIEDFPDNSSMPANVLVNADNEDFKFNHIKGRWPFDIFLLIAENSEVDDLVNKINNNSKILDPYVQKIEFQPLDEMYLSDKITDGEILRGSPKLLNILKLIALIILTLALINYINLTSSQLNKRGKEIGIRKTIGAFQKNISALLITEASLILFISFGVALILVQIFLPFYKDLFYNGFSILVIVKAPIIYYIILTLILLSIISGIVTTSLFLKASPIKILTNKVLTVSNRRKYMQNLLTTFQFIVSIALIFSLIVIQRQIKYVKNKNLGFKKEQLLCIHMPPYYEIKKSKINLLIDKLKQYPEIIKMSATDGAPGNIGVTMDANTEGINASLKIISVDSLFLETFKIKVVKGRTIEPGEYGRVCLFNEEAYKLFKWDNLENRKFNNGRDGGFDVIGVVENFHFNSLYNQIQPMAILFYSLGDEGNLNIKIASGKNSYILEKIKKAWFEVYPDYALKYRFYDEWFNNMYKKEERLASTISLFSILAIVISVMGIMGLSIFIIEARIKEIGIRKVNGAKTVQIIAMLNKELIIWVAIAFVIACPIAWYAMHKWLETFAYKTELSWWIFALAGIITLGIALLTVSWQTWRAARRNPVEALRYE